MKKLTVIKIVSFMGAAVLVMGGFWVKERSRSERYLLMIENQYSQSMETLNASLNNISLTLEKSLYFSSAKQMSSFASKIFSEAELAKEALSKLPTGESGLSTLYKFLSQVGNYTLSISKSVISGNAINEKQREELKLLSDTAKIITNVISDSQVNFNNSKYWGDSVENKLNESVNEGSLAESLTQLEEDMSDYPTLIYDGPYSDHILNKTPLMTTNAVEFSQESALEIANAAVGGGLKYEDMQKGKIEGYRFVNDNATVTVSKKGGYVVYMRKNRIVGDNSYSYEQALVKARRFLEDMNFLNMVDTYYFTDEGVCVINFAYLDGQTICYTDLIKVGVAMDTGEIMLFETSGYLTNHTERAFQVPPHTEEEALERVNKELEVRETAMTLIPTSSGGEVRCYEFLCYTQQQEEILIYINTATLEEEQIYILLKTDGGTLVK